MKLNRSIIKYSKKKREQNHAVLIVGIEYRPLRVFLGQKQEENEEEEEEEEEGWKEWAIHNKCII